MKKSLPILAISLYAGLCGSLRADADALPEMIEARVDSDGVQRVRIVGGEYFFKPQHVIVKSGIPVELFVAKSPGIVPHTFVIDAPQAGIAVDEELGGEPRRIAFTPTTAGNYPYYCRSRLLLFKNHRERGMEGVLQVVP
ncbi:quinol oxidase [Noviherbaspirillum cavernae]|uniref:Quinol oxidase n=1 Tax=Noviherbaspirillum cavernae TaxID=2320862 RepID=A0A418X1X8_9BURK|nr:quinol oxidase [Noviherbaspirillum cavernae]RJG06435.1 quinol oxidase [Noviherbaspirillum cavernae]